MKRYKRSFASDNNSIVHPKIMEALINVNNSHELSYGDDPYTESARKRFKEVLGQSVRFTCLQRHWCQCDRSCCNGKALSGCYLHGKCSYKCR